MLYSKLLLNALADQAYSKIEIRKNKQLQIQREKLEIEQAAINTKQFLEGLGDGGLAPSIHTIYTESESDYDELLLDSDTDESGTPTERVARMKALRNGQKKADAIAKRLRQ